MSKETFVSFVTIAYNEADNIARALDAIGRLDDLGEYEIIVVDDGSRDGTAQVVASIALQNPRVHLIELAENRGRGHARSVGIAKARGGLIAMVDADIILPADWLTRTRDALEGHDAAGGTTVPDGDVAYIYRRFRLVPRIVRGTTTVTGNNGLYRRQVFDVIAFDPTLRDGEDIALNQAMKRHGLSALTVHGLLVEHKESKRLGTSLKWLFDSGRGATRQLLAYHEIRQPDLAAAAFVGTTMLGALLVKRKHPVLGMAVPPGFVLAASIQHVRTRFETPLAQWSRVVPAVVVDSAMLAAYFAGRIAGTTTLLSHRKRRIFQFDRITHPDKSKG